MVDTKHSASMPNDTRYQVPAISAAADTTLMCTRSAGMNAPLIAEVKARANGAGFGALEKWLGDYDALFLRRNGTAPLVLVPWRTWARILSEVLR